MNIEAARRDLASAIEGAQPDADADARSFSARRIIITHGAAAVGTPYSDELSLGDVLLDAANAPPTPERRNLAVLVIEALAAHGLIPSTSERADIDRNICVLAESALSDVLHRFKYPFKGQSYEKRRTLEGLHANIVELLGPLASPPRNLAGLLSNRSRLTKCLADTAIETYFGASSVRDLSAGVQRVFETLSELRHQEDAAFHAKLRMAEEAVGNLRDLLGGHSGEVADAVEGFLRVVDGVVSRLVQETAPLLVSEIGTARPEPRVAVKRYQLHESGRELSVVILLVNKGPGWAYDVTVRAITESDSIYVDEAALEIGDVRPGEFSVAIRVLVGTPCRDAGMLLEVSWRMAGSSETQDRIFSGVLEAQRADVDWSDLETRDPYSITVAEGPRFVGREARVRSISSRIIREVMESVIIEGQKRVGKSSLALAVRDAVTAQSNGNTHVTYREIGDYGRVDPSDTVAAVGRIISDEMLRYLPASVPRPSLDFQGTLAPLSELARTLQDCCPSRRFLIILDDFDEIHPELYNHSRLADVFFQHLRTFSAQKNIAMMLVGGERLRYILSRQGDQLNRFSVEHLSYFSRSAEWEDYTALVQQPSQPDVNWDLASVTRLFELTNGHPYFTKLLCREAFRVAVAARDTEITPIELNTAVANLAGSLDLNHFAHFWMDGILAEADVAPSIELDRRRLLIAAARARRSGQAIQLDSIVQHKDSLLEKEKVRPYLDEFVHREILCEENLSFRFNLPLFEFWLINAGVTKLIPEQSAQEQAALARRSYDEVFVTSTEIAKLTGEWPVYRGQAIGPERVRAWLDQVQSNVDQRILFKLLKRLRFVSEADIREKLNRAHATVRIMTNPRVPARVAPGSRSGSRSYIHQRISGAQRRYDLVVTYVDGEGKSGQYYASKYAEENLISTQCVIGQSDFARRMQDLERERGTVTGIVIVDDVVATGGSLLTNLRGFLAENPMIKERMIPVIVVVLLATATGEAVLRDAMEKEMGSNIDLRVCEHVETTLQAFGDEGAWASLAESERANSLVRTLGTRVYRNHPLGYGDLGLLLVFPQTVPNNSLPILHSQAKGSDRWEPLFPRPVN
jgi:hypothetical protein